MSIISKTPRVLLLLAMLTGTASGSLAAQAQDPSEGEILATVYAPGPPDAAEMTEGPQVEGIISARDGDRMHVTTADGTRTIITINDDTRISASGGLLGLKPNELAATSLHNGLPVRFETLTWTGGLGALRRNLKKSKHK